MRVQEALLAVRGQPHLVPLPLLLELRRGQPQPLDQGLPAGFGDMVGHRAAELGDHGGGGRLVVEQHPLPVRLGEGQPQEVAVLARDRVQVADQVPVGPVVGEHVAAAVRGDRGQRLQLRQDRLKGRGDGGAHADRRRVLRLGEREQVAALVGAEQQGARDGVQHLRRDLNVARLLQPGVPGDPDRGELRHLLAAQARCAAAADGGQPDLLGRDPLPATAQEGGEFAAADLVRVGRRVD